jgi:hypothetical protein
LLCGGSQTLPWQSPCDKVHEDVAEGFHVISPALLDPQVSVDAGIASRSRQIFILPVRNVLMGTGVPVFFGQAEVNNVNEVALLP